MINTSYAIGMMAFQTGCTAHRRLDPLFVGYVMDNFIPDPDGHVDIPAIQFEGLEWDRGYEYASQIEQARLESEKPECNFNSAT